MVKCLNVGQVDTVTFQPKHIKQQPTLKYSQVSSKEYGEEPSKSKYYDQANLKEVYFERCLDVLYCKL